MVSGRLIIFYSGTDASNPPQSEADFANNPVYAAFIKAVKEVNGTGTGFEIFEAVKGAERDNGVKVNSLPSFVLQVNGGQSFILTGGKSFSEYYTSFKNILSAGGASGSDPSEYTGGSGFGLNPDGYAYTRKCNPVDDFLKWLKLGEGLKRGIYGVGAAFFAYNTLRSPNTLIMSVNGGISAGFLYLFFGKEDCPFDIPTLESNAKTIAIGGAAGLALLLGYQFYLKPTIQERRIKRIVRAARGDDKPKSTTAAQRSTTRKKPKSVTVTKRF